MLKMEQIKEQTVDELKVMYRDLSREIFELRNEMSISKKIEKPHLLRSKKRDRARILTVMRQKGGAI